MQFNDNTNYCNVFAYGNYLKAGEIKYFFLLIIKNIIKYKNK